MALNVGLEKILTLGGECCPHIGSCHRQLKHRPWIATFFVTNLMIINVIIIINIFTPRLGRTRGVGRRADKADPAMAGMK